ncbi:MAG TPA: hypothetical protein V6D35_19905, partial [Candidatus Sericytochromatia bacterium]
PEVSKIQIQSGSPIHGGEGISEGKKQKYLLFFYLLPLSPNPHLSLCSQLPHTNPNGYGVGLNKAC